MVMRWSASMRSHPSARPSQSSRGKGTRGSRSEGMLVRSTWRRFKESEFLSPSLVRQAMGTSFLTTTICRQHLTNKSDLGTISDFRWLGFAWFAWARAWLGPSLLGAWACLGLGLRRLAAAASQARRRPKPDQALSSPGCTGVQIFNFGNN